VERYGFLISEIVPKYAIICTHLYNELSPNLAHENIRFKVNENPGEFILLNENNN
jgi:hypothetical protein